jgi:Phosphotyrosyl phosphate activator (PTPA) protein
MATLTQESLLHDYTPQEPTKRIFSDKDIASFTKSEAFARIVDFVKLLNTSVSNQKITDPCHESEVRFLSLLKITTIIF